MIQRSMKLSAVVTAALVFSAPLLSAAQYEVDNAHSSVGFVIRHLVSKVRGQFNEYTATFNYDPKAPEKSKVEATIQVKSIDTNIDKRDEHLRSADFFNVAKYPTITFKSKSAKSAGPNKLEVAGDFTMLGVTKPVILMVEATEPSKDPWGGMRTGFTATTTVNRKDFGMVYNKVLDNGGLMLGEDVKVEIEIEGIQKK